MPCQATQLRARLAFQLLGTLIALSSLTFFIRGLYFLTRSDWGGIVPLIIGVYFLFVGYAGWFRFSPKAIGHICGASGFWLFYLRRLIPGWDLTKSDPKIGGIFVLLWLIIVIIICRRAFQYTRRLIFEQPKEGDGLP